MDLSNLTTDDIAQEIGFEVLRRMSAEKRVRELTPPTAPDELAAKRAERTTDEGAPLGA